MRFGFVVPYAEAREFADLAALGEQSGWDGVFTWESLYGEHAWVTLGAAAMTTSRIRLGTLLTPVSRHRPWDLASMVSTVDRLSGGRVVMCAGLGALRAGRAARAASARAATAPADLGGGRLPPGTDAAALAGAGRPLGRAARVGRR
jgi:alkanesulfonate monooxygenase SsuD/methylene tetrahydromethanopterin reductase-like flavin-dependent oxidoreductase (luciferase family)